jgi:hypothetical protein
MSAATDAIDHLLAETEQRAIPKSGGKRDLAPWFGQLGLIIRKSVLTEARAHVVAAEAGEPAPEIRQPTEAEINRILYGQPPDTQEPPEGMARWEWLERRERW